MFTRPKGWLTGAIWKPKNLHSLEHLKFLYSVLCKNQTVTEQNKSLLVETLRSISEILIWGDQNDSSVFDFFLEKNMLAFFLRFMRQKSGRYICVQLLQTLNILFENISNETSVYYLLSNNHINSIIVHKFDFSDEEVMAYYISFLKTLSLKLNKHTIHFFYNEHTNDFALYTEAIKFFNHPESMVRIAVRTITLNVYKVDDKSMLRYIRDKTAAPYFSNLVWFIGNHIIELDSCVRNDAEYQAMQGREDTEAENFLRSHNSRDRLADLVAEHLDHLHYLNDILCLNIDALNEVLTDHLLNRLLIPLYVYSLTKRRKFSARTDDRPHVSSVVSLFLLSQVFLIISHAPLVRQLADIIFNGDIHVCMGDTADSSESPQPGTVMKNRLRCFVKPPEPLAQTLESNRGPGKPVRRPNYKNASDESGSSPPSESGSGGQDPAAAGSERDGTAGEGEEEEGLDESEAALEEQEEEGEEEEEEEEEEEKTDTGTLDDGGRATGSPREMVSPGQNSTDEEKLLQGGATSMEQRQAEFSLKSRPYLEAIFSALECSENDYEALFSLCLLYAMGHNLGLNQELLDSVLMPTDCSETKDHYNIVLIEKLIHLINLSCQTGSKVRLATLEMATLLLKQLVYTETHCFLQDRHLAAVEGAREESTLLLRNFYKSEEIFLDMFEDEFREMKNRPLNVEYLMMDASILLPPTGTPLTGIEFNKRLPCGEVERARRAIRVFFLLRHLSLTLRQEEESSLPLTKQEECVKVNDVLDLNNSDLIACTVITRDQQTKRERRFLVIDLLQLILVEPDTRRLGWGVVKFVGFLQDVEVTGDKDDSRSLHITIHKPSMNMHARPLPLLGARFVFDDHIRCMAAKQRLTKGRLKARQRKMQMIARLLELPTHIVDAIYQPPQYPQSAMSLRTAGGHGGSSTTAAPSGGSNSSSVPGRLVRHPGQAQGQRAPGEPRSVFASVDQVPGFNAVREKDGRGRKSSKRAMSQPIPIHAPIGGPVRQAATGANGNGGGGRSSQAHHQGSPEIEEAQEATPSPEAHAFKSLNPLSQEIQAEHKSNGRGSRSSSTDRAPAVQEIPLEDMSKKAKGKASRRRAEGMQKRSDSQSPQRTNDAAAASALPAALNSSPTSARLKSEHRRQRKSKGDEDSDEKSSSGSPSKAASQKPTVAGKVKGSVQKQRSKDSERASPEATAAAVVESAAPVADSKDEGGNEADDESTPPKVVMRSRSSSGGAPPPASLMPAQEPSVSLLSQADDVLVSATDSPRLLPPVEPERLRSLSDPSATVGGGGGANNNTSFSADSSVGSAEASPTDAKPRPPFAISAKCPSSVDENRTPADAVETASPGENASEHLNRLSQQQRSLPSSPEPGSEDAKNVPLTPMNGRPIPDKDDDDGGGDDDAARELTHV